MKNMEKNNIKNRIREFEYSADYFEKYRKMKTFIDVKKKYISPWWGFTAYYFLRYIDFKNYENVVKMDLWDEAVTFHPDIKKEIVNLLKPKRLIFIEWSKKICKKYLKLKSSNEFIINGDINLWPFKKESIYVVIDVSTLDHQKLYELKIALKRIYRSLKRCGYFIFIYANGNFLKKGSFFDKKRLFFDTYPIKPEELEKIIKDANFKIVKKSFIFNFMLHNEEFTALSKLNEFVFRILYYFRFIGIFKLFQFLETILLQDPEYNIYLGYLLMK